MYSGTVVDVDSSDPIIGVNVALKDTRTGTVTDLSGKFSISAPVVLHFYFLISDTLRKRLSWERVPT
nr:carboxypeptidase-like regulatory domain-containing protein [Bacteroides reticulotermitis]